MLVKSVDEIKSSINSINRYMSILLNRDIIETFGLQCYLKFFE